MSSPTRQSLIPLLLLWVAILTVVQVAFIVFFFVADHHSQSQKGSAAAPEPPMPLQENNTPPQPPSERGVLLGKGKMLTFEVHSHMKWSAKNPDRGLVSEEKGGRVLKIMRDGYFFLNLQVTLSSCNATGGGSRHAVSVKSDGDVILQGRINGNTCSTGLLGKVEELSAGSLLEVHWPTTEELINESLTHLDIIYMNKP